MSFMVRISAAVSRVGVDRGQLTVLLPAGDIAFLKGYARQHGITVTEALHRYLCRLREMERADIHPEGSRFTGLVPSDVEATEAHAAHLEEKHQGDFTRSPVRALSPEEFLMDLEGSVQDD